MTTKEKHTHFIKNKALELGFSSVGISEAVFLEEEAPRMEAWLSKNYHGKMTYLERNFDKRLDPRLLVEGAKSVVSLVYNYYPSQKLKNDSYKIAKYAYGADYHDVIKNKLKKLFSFIQEEIGAVNGRFFTDSAPVMERAWAEKSGIGWRGKNSLLIQKKHGSFYFLAVLIMDLALEYDAPYQTDHCATCRRCVDACPTQAILPNNTVDGSKCIAYFTIELKDSLPSFAKDQLQDWIFGCDVCQDVCPWNRLSKPHEEPLFEPAPALLDMDTSDWENLTQEVFSNVFKNSALKRAKFKGLKRNIDFVKSNKKY